MSSAEPVGSSPSVVRKSLVDQEGPKDPSTTNPSPSAVDVSQSSDPKIVAPDQEAEALKAVPVDLSIEELSAIARDRVELIIRGLLHEGGINASKVQIPAVRVSAEQRSSSYAPGRNEIVIHRSSFDCIHTYGEETFHWLRMQLKPESERSGGERVLPWKERFAVEEFFGFIGRAVVSKLCEKTSLAELCLDSKNAASAETVARHRADADQNERLATSISLDRLRAIESFANHAYSLRKLSLQEGPICTTTFSRKVNFGIVVLEEMRASFGPPVPDDDPRASEAKHLLACERMFTQARQEFDKARGAAEAGVEGDCLEFVMHHWCRLAGLLHEALVEFVDVSERRHKQLETNRDESEMHFLGYSRGLGFLEREGAESGKIFKILKEPSKKVYFDHIFEKETKSGDRPWISKLAALAGDYVRYRKEQRRLTVSLKDELNAARAGFNPYTEEGREAQRRADALVASLPAKYRGIRLG